MSQLTFGMKRPSLKAARQSRSGAKAKIRCRATIRIFSLRVPDTPSGKLGSIRSNWASTVETTSRLARGLGSSSAATVTGIVAAFVFAGYDLNDLETLNWVFAIAADIEGHPDNAAPAVFGGCQIGVYANDSSDDSGWINSRIEIPEELKAVVFVPDFSMKTVEARGILPDVVSRSDAVFNVGRAAMLVHAIESRQWHLLRHATDDRLHQPQRIAKLFPRFGPIARGALDAGAHGVFLSGAGPAIMAFATDRFMTICYEMSENARKAQVEGKALILDLSNSGVQVEATAST